MAALALAALAALATSARPAGGATPGGGALAGLDSRLAGLARVPDAGPVAVWVALRDKGEQGPADLAARLAAAAAALDPHARARRERAQVEPLVDYSDLPLHRPYVDAIAAQGLTPFGASRWMNRVAVRATGAQLARLAALPFVARVEPVQRALRAHDPPAEPAPLVPPRETAGLSSIAVSYGQTAAMMTQIGVPAVHDSGFIGTGVRIAILDEGFNFYNKHEATRTATVVGRRDFVDHDNFVTDTTQGSWFSHGTWTMGCMAGNKPGIYVGSAFGAQFLLARTEDSFSEKPVEMVNWGMAAEWADSAGADLISSSLGYTTFPDSTGTDYTVADMNGHTTIVSRYAEIAASKGILVVNSAGNEGNRPWLKIVAPADVNGDSLIAAGAVDASGVPASFTSHGPSADGRVKPDLAARGKSVPLCSASGDPQAYVTLDGTSFSCPILAGLAACLLQARPAWTPTLVIKALRETASRFANPDTLVGYGIPNGLAALRWIPDTAAVPPAPPGFARVELLGPNPLRSDGPAAHVRFVPGAEARTGARATVRVFDAAGRAVRDLWSGVLGSQPIVVAWDGLGRHGEMLGSGLYLITLEAGGHRSAVRVVSLR